MTSGWFTHPPASEPSDHTLEPWSLCAVLGSRDVTRAAWRSHHPSVFAAGYVFLTKQTDLPKQGLPTRPTKSECLPPLDGIRQCQNTLGFE